MSLQTPLDTINRLLTARANRDIAAALVCYEPNATVVLEPGKMASGKTAIAGFTEAAIALPIVFGRREIIEAGDLALHLSQWTLRQADGSEVGGCTCDVLRRQNGDWLLVIDNPWGIALLDRPAASSGSPGEQG